MAAVVIWKSHRAATVMAAPVAAPMSQSHDISDTPSSKQMPCHLCADAQCHGDRHPVTQCPGMLRPNSHCLCILRWEWYVRCQGASRASRASGASGHSLCVRTHIFFPDGHMGQDKTVELVRRNFFWPQMDSWIRDYVGSCEDCQKDKAIRHARYGLLQPLEVPYAPWDSISMDFITDLPLSDV